MPNENPRLESEGVPSEVAPELTNAGRLVLKMAIEEGDEERVAEFAQYPDVVRALYEEYVKAGNGQLAQLMRDRYRDLL